MTTANDTVSLPAGWPTRTCHPAVRVRVSLYASQPGTLATGMALSLAASLSASLPAGRRARRGVRSQRWPLSLESSQTLVGVCHWRLARYIHDVLARYFQDLPDTMPRCSVAAESNQQARPPACQPARQPASQPACPPATQKASLATSPPASAAPASIGMAAAATPLAMPQSRPVPAPLVHRRPAVVDASRSAAAAS